MRRPIALLGAPSSIGIRPYDDGTQRWLDRAPETLRRHGIVARLAATDRGDVLPPPYRDFARPPGAVRNEDAVARYSHALSQRVAGAAADGSFVLVLGGDCSIVLGCVLGAKKGESDGGGKRNTDRKAGATDDELDSVGLVYIDGHSDFATPQESVTGSAAAMCAAMVVGRGETPLARLDGDAPLVRPAAMAIVGRRDEAEADIYGQAALRASLILDLPQAAIRERGARAAAAATLSHLKHAGVTRFWIHVDADVLDESIMPAVDSPEPHGMSVEQLHQLLEPLVNDPGAVGLELTIYDPKLDPDQGCASTLASLLESTFEPPSLWRMRRRCAER